MIYKYPDPVLLKKSEPVTLEEGLKVVGLLLAEIKKLKWGQCVGLAAPQIGINKRVFIAQDVAYINPEIFFCSPEKKEYKEGCYSLKENKFDYHVHRSFVIKMRWMSIKGEMKERSFNAFPAQVLQHEYDHLEGLLCNHEEL